MKKILLCLIGILLVIIEGSITNYIHILDVSFNLVIVYCTIISLYLDELEAGIIGAIIGLIKDIAFGGVFGLNSLILFSKTYFNIFVYKSFKNFSFFIFDFLDNCFTNGQFFQTSAITRSSIH